MHDGEQSDERSWTKRTKWLLTELKKVGLTDDEFHLVHHLPYVSIEDPIGYCDEVDYFVAGGTNERVSMRLGIVLAAFESGNDDRPAPPGVLRRLCVDALRRIPK